MKKSFFRRDRRKDFLCFPIGTRKKVSPYENLKKSLMEHAKSTARKGQRKNSAARKGQREHSVSRKRKRHRPFMANAAGVFDISGKTPPVKKNPIIYFCFK